MAARGRTTRGVVAARRRPPLRIRLACNAITALVWTVYVGLGIATAAAYGYLDMDRPGVGPVVSAEVVVVGGGIAGLAAAWELRDRDVVVLEADDRVGGRLLSVARDPYWLNFGGHVLAGPDSATGRLLTAAGVEAPPVPGVLTALA